MCVSDLPHSRCIIRGKYAIRTNDGNVVQAAQLHGLQLMKPSARQITMHATLCAAHAPLRMCLAPKFRMCMRVVINFAPICVRHTSPNRCPIARVNARVRENDRAYNYRENIYVYIFKPYEQQIARARHLVTANASVNTYIYIYE